MGHVKESMEMVESAILDKDQVPSGALYIAVIIIYVRTLKAGTYMYHTLAPPISLHTPR